MWLLFDRNGKLLKQVEYSKLAYVTSTNFYLFCVFENVSLDNIGLAHLSLKKPSGDLLNFEIAGTPEVKTFVVPNESLESSYLPFVNGQEYGGVRFDFSETGFLNEVGLWKGTITFYNALLGTRNLTGLFTFMVQKSVVNTQIGPISYDEYLLLLGEIAKKQDHLIAGANITIENSVISATGGGGSGGDCPDLRNYVTLEELYNYHDDTKQNVISLANKLPVEFIEGDIKTVTKLSELENDVGYATVDWVNSIIPDQYDDTAIKLRLNKIEGVIPAQANELNELADKNFVNSSISTATATFKGTFDNLDELQQTSADLNDYAYFKHTDNNGNTVYSKYKYSDGAWAFEYDLNTTGFTAAQWATINSGLTANSIPTNYVTTDTEQRITAKKVFAVKPTCEVEKTIGHYLPDEYQEVEYIQSSGSQYIDTGINPQVKPRVVMKMAMTNSGDSDYFGNSSINGSAFFGNFSSYGLNFYRYGSTSALNTGISVKQNEWHEWDMSQSVYLDGNLRYTTTNTYTYNSSQKNICIFKCRNYASYQLAYFILYDGEEKVREFYPCYRKSDSVIGLYDKVTNKFYPNNGSGVFIKGANVQSGTFIEEYEFLTSEDLKTFSYNDLLDKPLIPTKTSQLTNDSNYLTKTNGDSYYQAKGNYALKSEIPTKTSELTNDSNFAKHIYHTTEEWNNLSTFIGEKGTICIWTDYKTYEDDGQTIVEPGIKISNGVSPVVDLGFIGSENAKILLEHIEDRTIHIIDKEREKWNNKIEIEAEPTIENETLYLNK